MKHNELGNTGRQVSALSLGSWHTYSRLTFEAGVQIISQAYEQGVNFLDTGYYRDTPHTEVVFGQAVRAAGIPREDLFVSGRLWHFWHPEESMETQLSKSLTRLGMDYLDLAYVQHPSPDMDPLALAEEAAELVNKGMLKSFGTLNWRAADLQAAITSNSTKDLATPQAALMKYSLVRRNVLDGSEYAGLLEQNNVSLHASDVLEGGILAGRIDRDRKIGIDIGGIRDKIYEKVPAILAAADKLGVPPAQFAIAFALLNRNTASVLVGVTRLEQLNENIAAVNLAMSRPEEILEAAQGFGIEEHEIDPPYENFAPLVGNYIW